MHDFEIVLALLFVAALVQPVAHKLDVPIAIAQVAAGLLLSAVPFFPAVDFAPELIFTLFVPPLVYTAAATGSLRDTRRHAGAIFLLAVALVLITMCAVAVVAHGVAPDLPWASAFVLGAVVAPPDADVTTAVVRRLGLPASLVTILEGETLLNDTTAFVSYRMAVRAATIGAFSLAISSARFAAITLGGIGVGLAAGSIVAQLRRRLSDPIDESLISLLTPFGTYILAEHYGASGVLAVVTAGICVSRFLPRTVSPAARVRATMVWQTVSFTIGGFVFMLIGLRLGKLIPTLWHRDDLGLIRVAAIVTVSVVVVRFAWIFLASWARRAVHWRTAHTAEIEPSWRALAVLGWSGLRGGDTLVMALALPYATAAGRPFPGRDLIVAVAFGVILTTLVIQGLTLRPIIRWLGIPRDFSVGAEEEHARLAAAHAGMKRIDELSEHEGLATSAAGHLRADIVQRTRLALDDIAHVRRHDGQTAEDITRRAEREARDAGRDAVVRLRDADAIGDEAMRRVLDDLDLEELRDSNESVDAPPDRT